MASGRCESEWIGFQGSDDESEGQSKVKKQLNFFLFFSSLEKLKLVNSSTSPRSCCHRRNRRKRIECAIVCNRANIHFSHSRRYFCVSKNNCRNYYFSPQAGIHYISASFFLLVHNNHHHNMYGGGNVIGIQNNTIAQWGSEHFYFHFIFFLWIIFRCCWGRWDTENTLDDTTAHMTT